jgi:hypothetical protein
MILTQRQNPHIPTNLPTYRAPASINKGGTWQGRPLQSALKIKCGILIINVSHSGNNHKGARSSSRPYISCNVSSVNEYDKAADLNDRLKLFLSCSSSICNDFADDGKLGYEFTSANELEEVDIGLGDKLRSTFVSKKLDPSL